jgi:hypothetical protein
VKPFVKGQKNDYSDTEAVVEAALRPNLRVVREKTQDELDLQAYHRIRAAGLAKGSWDCPALSRQRLHWPGSTQNQRCTHGLLLVGPSGCGVCALQQRKRSVPSAGLNEQDLREVVSNLRTALTSHDAFPHESCIVSCRTRARIGGS